MGVLLMLILISYLIWLKMLLLELEEIKDYLKLFSRKVSKGILVIGRPLTNRFNIDE